MSLFNTRNNLPTEPSTNGEGRSSHADTVVVSGAVTEIVNGASIKFFKKYLGTIEHDKHYHFWTGGQWNMHELMAYLLTITGKAEMYVTTWAISEDAVRMLMFLNERGLIKSLKFVFDYKAKEQKTNAYLLAKSNFETVLTKVHAKVTILKNDDWKVCITGSANWTRNPRAERQLICTVGEVVDADIQIIEKLMMGVNPFKIR